MNLWDRVRAGAGVGVRVRVGVGVLLTPSRETERCTGHPPAGALVSGEVELFLPVDKMGYGWG